MERELAAGASKAWQAALTDWDARLEDAAARRAARAFEALAAGRDSNAQGWCARAWYYVADYAEGTRSRIRYFERGARWGRMALKGSESTGALFWTAACTGGHADLQSVLRRAALVPELLKLLTRILDREPDYYFGGLDRYLGQALVRQPGLAQRLIGTAFPAFAPDRLVERLWESVERDPPFVLTHQTLGQLAWSALRDRRTAREMLDRIDGLDLQATPMLAPENHRDAPRARSLLEEIVGGRG